MCTCNAQLLPHDRLDGVCPDPEPIPCDDCGWIEGHNEEVEH